MPGANQEPDSNFKSCYGVCPHSPDWRKKMKQPIVGYHLDEEDHWVAELDCGHNQHVRHNPPLVSRPWVVSEAGRASMLGHELDCKKCDRGEPVDNK